MASSKFVDANGLRLHYLDHGTASLPPLVCIHGLTGNAHNFDGLAPMLSKRYQLMSLDVRGRGDSQWGPADQYTFPHYVSDLRAMLDELAVGRVSLIGTSMGGIISMLFASTYPDRVARVVLNDIGPEVARAGLSRIAGYVGDSPSEFKDLSEVVTYYRKNYPPTASLPESTLAQWCQWSVKPTASGTLTWKMDPAVRNPMRSGNGTAVAPDLWRPYREIKTPLMVLRGGDSDILTAETAKRMCEVLPTARLVEVPGVGHAPSLLEAAALSALEEFLQV